MTKRRFLRGGKTAMLKRQRSIFVSAKSLVEGFEIREEINDSMFESFRFCKNGHEKNGIQNETNEQEIYCAGCYAEDYATRTFSMFPLTLYSIQ